MPFFSIVIPTRNRGHLLRYSLQSAMNQNFKDYEIVVCDNNSNDNTPEVVKDLAKENVRYVRTPESFSMPDNWEYALSHAEGKYITYLCDDDAISPNLLQTVSELIKETGTQVVTWSMGGYYHDNWEQEDCRNTLVYQRPRNRVINYDSKSALKGMFDELWPSFPVPKMLQSCCSREIIERIQAKIGRLFVPTCPDISSPLFILSEIESYLHLDKILMVSGAARESTGANQHKQEVIEKFFQEFKDQEIFDHVPLSAKTGINTGTDTLLRARSMLGDKLREYELNWELYYVLNYQKILESQQEGADVEADFKEFHDALEREDKNLRDKVMMVINSRKPIPLWRKSLRRTINSNFAFKKLELLLRPHMKYLVPQTIDGNKAGFHNILECTQKLDSLVNGHSNHQSINKYAY